MTGRPSFTFRDTEESPECGDCGTDMVFLRQEGGVYNERDVYACSDCGTTFQDRWTF
ncbi:MAG: hypothetical protein SVW02_04340 [Candidatus Nanohaloarchaea archaeon]|nr:hypothetical protein [Candidatus Nanohaloarchaea archaeon]